MYNYENCKFYSECIAISTDAASFNVEIFHQTNCTTTKIGKANVLLNRHPALIGKKINISFQIFDGIDNINSSNKLHELIAQHCVERILAI